MQFTLALIAMASTVIAQGGNAELNFMHSLTFGDGTDLTLSKGLNSITAVLPDGKKETTVVRNPFDHLLTYTIPRYHTASPVAARHATGINPGGNAILSAMQSFTVEDVTVTVNTGVNTLTAVKPGGGESMTITYTNTHDHPLTYTMPAPSRDGKLTISQRDEPTISVEPPSIDLDHEASDSMPTPADHPVNSVSPTLGSASDEASLITKTFETLITWSAIGTIPEFEMPEMTFEETTMPAQTLFSGATIMEPVKPRVTATGVVTVPTSVMEALINNPGAAQSMAKGSPAWFQSLPPDVRDYFRHGPEVTYISTTINNIPTSVPMTTSKASTPLLDSGVAIVALVVALMAAMML